MGCIRNDNLPAGGPIAEVIVDVPVLGADKPYDYRIPPDLSGQVQPGSRVAVPFGPRKVQGYVINIKGKETHQGQLKHIEAVLDDQPPLTEELLALSEWMSEKYVCFRSTAIQAMLPSALKARTTKEVIESPSGEKQVVYEISDNVTARRVSYVTLLKEAKDVQRLLQELPKQALKQRAILGYLLEHEGKVMLTELLQACQASRSSVQSLQEKGIVTIATEEVERDPYAGRSFAKTDPLPLTPAQKEVFGHIIKAIEKEQFQTYLLHGVTGSGKTEVYLQAIAHVLKKGKEAIVLVPEISLTPQMVERFKGRFGDQVAVVHSRLSVGERYDTWRKIRNGQAKIVIGARSALFAPFERLGLIIIDEEHESSYKQEENPRYHARDVAIFRGQYHQAPVILGSATPSLESYARARKNVYTLLSLKERVHGRALPKVEVVDMRQELQSGNRTLFSRHLYQKIEERLEQKEQMVLFINRRGFSTFVMCRDCGFVLQCPHCDISLTYHKVNHTCRCHYCGHTERQLMRCPNCQSEHIRFFGTGTQKVEEALAQTFPGIRVIRMDVDTTRRKGAHEKLLHAFGQHKADCLLGTQMIAKGLDFDNVTLVGVIAADSMLHLPDFRAAERTFQLLTQVSGRAGRRQKPGEVVIQTYTPDHYSIQCASQHDYHTFYEQEMRYRFQKGYPPFYYLSLLLFSHPDLTYCIKAAEEAANWLKPRLSKQSQVLGPVAAPIPKIKDRYRYQCMIKYKNESQLSRLLMELLHYMQPHIAKYHLQLQIDMEPQVIL
ncbi:primosomal protein N' [Caldalkalibacillus thermarum TA2.A1]|uniref:Replication restart protein PriA n=1 Tax=Caldalkalibacillus thermarum (strain TA2.A1) TaxID=986075 RepID=F5L7U9_CALTT|nr:primosomal protein N' [Caldalkalibacillus thermarum]EGL82608.1 primosomal protein N' [Caldalkalibacillus thermarum TA2.A1]